VPARSPPTTEFARIFRNMGWTQADAARVLGIHYVTLYRACLAEPTPPLSKLAKLIHNHPELAAEIEAA
jgi:hypothetical protein